MLFSENSTEYCQINKNIAVSAIGLPFHLETPPHKAEISKNKNQHEFLLGPLHENKTSAFVLKNGEIPKFPPFLLEGIFG